MGNLVIPAQTTPVWGDLAAYIEDDSSISEFSLRQGRAWIMATVLNHTVRGEAMYGFWPSSTLDDEPSCALYTLSDQIRVRIGATTVDNTGAVDEVAINYDAAADYPIALAYTGQTYHVFVKRGDWWWREWVQNHSDLSNYSGLSNYDSTGLIKDRLVLRDRRDSLLAPDIEIESPVVGTGSISGGEDELPAFAYIFEFEIEDLPSSGVIRIIAQYLEGAGFNHFYWEIDSAGALAFGVSYDGSDIEYVTSGTVVVGDIVRIFHDVFDVKVFANESLELFSFDNTFTTGYASGVNSGAWEVADLGIDGAISNLRVYKRVLREPTGDFGADEIVNGGFAADTDWTKGTGWTITGGKAVKAPGTGSYLEAAVDPLTEGKIYKVSVTASDWAAGYFQINTGSDKTMTGLFQNSGDGTFEVYQPCELGTVFKIFATSAFDAKIDDVMAQEVIMRATELGNILSSMLS
jgi:hypothetical protein